MLKIKAKKDNFIRKLQTPHNKIIKINKVHTTLTATKLKDR
jgi:hypothetical protein